VGTYHERLPISSCESSASITKWSVRISDSVSVEPTLSLSYEFKPTSANGTAYVGCSPDVRRWPLPARWARTVDTRGGVEQRNPGSRGGAGGTGRAPPMLEGDQKVIGRPSARASFLE